MLASKEETISKLRRNIASWEGFRAPETGGSIYTGLSEIERSFPNGVFPTGAMHELIAVYNKHLCV